MLTWLSTETSFPPPHTALAEPAGPDGLLAAGGDLSPDRLLAAYAQGIFPWYAEGQPILWWSPDPRMVLLPDALKISRSLQKTLRNQAYSVRLDTAFAQTMTACATQPRPGQDGTWINQDMLLAYQQLHVMGYAHSVETWMDNTLVGGLYGVALGGVFYGESMFSRQRDASKIALAHLCAYLKQQEFGIIDCQMETPHLTSLGAGLISRNRFIATVQGLLNTGKAPGLWPALAIDSYFKVSP
jgi:leucyl/phenylalanyl-tRNA--protein transferase